MLARVPMRLITTWLILLGYAAVISGIPLPIGGSGAALDAAAGRRMAGKDRSRPFPCMDKPCGCATAEQCFENCCCHTPAQRLAWARSHDVEAAVLAALERRVAAAEHPAAHGESCCAAKSKHSPRPAPLHERVDVCDAYASLAAAPAADTCPDAAGADAPATDRVAMSSRTVVLREMLACGGVAAGWLAAGVSLPPPAHVAAIVTVSPPTAALVFIDAVAEGRRPLPDLPPPRV
jgi:hypothetical protein